MAERGELATDVMAAYLGKPSAVMLADSPFNRWEFGRSVEADLDEIVVDYVSVDGGMDVLADRRDTVGTIFLYFDDDRTFAGELSDVPSEMTRLDVIAKFGEPSKTGDGIDDPILGRSGAWDRFDRGDHLLHFEYDVDAGVVSKITMMRHDMAP